MSYLVPVTGLVSCNLNGEMLVADAKLEFVSESYWSLNSFPMNRVQFLSPFQ